MLSSRARDRFVSHRGTGNSKEYINKFAFNRKIVTNGLAFSPAHLPKRISTLSKSVYGSLDFGDFHYPSDVPEESESSSDVHWLSRFTPFDLLSPSALEELCACATETSIPPGQVVIRPTGQAPTEIFIVRQGQAQEESSSDGPFSMQQIIVPGCVLGWTEALTNRPFPHKVVSTTDMTLWMIPSAILKRLGQQPTRREAYAKTVARLVARQVEGLEAAILEEKKSSMARTRALTPFLVPPPKRGVIGNSSYSDRLRKAIVKQSRDLTMKPLLIFGEKGLDKSNLAGNQITSASFFAQLQIPLTLMYP